MSTWSKVLLIAFTGSLGAVARYGLQGLVHRQAGSIFPWGTMVVNLSGCLLFGVVWELAAERGLFSTELRAVILIGFLGAFTTFSSFAFETTQLMRGGEWLLAAANVAAQNILGIAAVLLGIWLAR